MGIDYSGGMIVGEIGSRLGSVDAPDGMSEWAEDNGMTIMAQHYDADSDWCYYGFEVPNIFVSEIDQAWLDNLRAKAAKFEELTKVPAKLVGTQNIW